MSTSPQAALFRPLLASLLLCLALPRQTSADLVIARFGGIDIRSDTGALRGSIGIPGAGYVTSVIQLSDGRLIAFDFTNSKYYVIGTDGAIGPGVATVPGPLTALALPSGGFLAAGSSTVIRRYDAAFISDLINTPFTTIYGLALTPNPIEILYSILTLQRLNLDTKVSTFVFNNTTGLGGLQYAGGIPNLPAGTAYVGAESAGPLFISASFTVLGRFTSPGQSGFTDVAALPNGSIAGCAPASGLCTLWNANGSVNSSFSAGVYPYNVIHIADGSGPSTCANQAVSLTAYTDPGTCRATVDQTKLFNLCPGWQVVNPVPDSAKEYLQGIHLETWTLSDGSQTKPLQTTVTVLDKEAPVLTTPGNFTVKLPPGETTVQVNFTVTASDNCSGAIPVHTTPASGTSLPLGVHTIVSQATDSGGNTGTSTFDVTVDPAAPFIKTVQTDPNLDGAWVYFSDEMSTSALDEMGYYSIDAGVTITDAQAFGSQVVHLSLTGLQNGNTYTLTVNDAELPVSPNQHTFTVNVTAPPGGLVNGIALWEAYAGAGSLEELNDAIETQPPNHRLGRASFEAPLNFAEDFGGRLRAYFKPPATGLYTFYTAVDDEGLGYLSTDADPAKKVLVTQQNDWTSYRQWVNEDDSNSSKFQNTQWAGGNQIGLAADNWHYIELQYAEGGGGDHATLTWEFEGNPPPANGTETALTGGLIGWYAGPDIPPVITTAPRSMHFQRGDSVTIEANVYSPTPVTYQWYYNKEAIPGATDPNLVIDHATTKDIGDYSFVVTNEKGSADTHLNDLKLIQTGKSVFNIEVADFNTGGGGHLPEASQSGYPGGAYFGKPASQDRDFNDNGDQSGGVAFDYLRFSPGDPYVAEIQRGPDQLWERDMGDFTVNQPYHLGWTGANEWYNYTRNFPKGTYGAFVEYSMDGIDPNDPNRIQVTFSIVDNPLISDGSSEGVEGGLQGLNVIGKASSPGTGAWGSNDILPVEDETGNLAHFSIDGEQTYRMTINTFGDPNRIRVYQVGPWVPELTNRITPEDTPAVIDFTTKDNNFTVSGVTADSDNRGLFPPGGITIVSDGDNHTVTLPPAENQSGSAIVTLTIRSNGDPVFRKFTLTVTPVDDPPTIGQINDVVVEEDSHPAQNPYRITLNGLSAGPADENQAYTVTTTSDNPGLVSHLVPGDLNGDGKVDLVDFGIDKDNFGSAEIKVTISDGNTSVDKIFNVTVTPVDDPPTIDPIPGQSWLEDGFSAQNPVRITLTGLSGGPPNENQAYTITATSDAPAVVPNPVVLDSNGDGTFDSLDLHSLKNAFGSADITVSISDGNTSVSTPFQVTVIGVNDPPVATAVQLVEPNQSGIFTLVNDPAGDPVRFNFGEDANLGPDGNPLQFKLYIQDVGPGGGADESDQQIRIGASTDNLGLINDIVVDPPILAPGGSEFFVSFKIAKDTSGQGTIRVEFDDQQPGGVTHYPIEIVVAPAGQVTVPNLVGEPLAEATAIIHQSNLTPGSVMEAYSDTVPPGHVTGQFPQAGTEVDPDTSVDLRLSKGPEPRVDLAVEMDGPATALLNQEVVYDFVVSNSGETAAQHVFFLVKLPRGFEVLGHTAPDGLSLDRRDEPLGEIYLNCDIGEMPPGQIFTFSVRATLTSWDAGLWPVEAFVNGLHQDSNPDDNLAFLKTHVLFLVPNAIRLSVDQARVTIENADLFVGEITEAYHPSIPAGLVMAQDPPFGAQAERYSRVNLVISLGPRPTEAPVATVDNGQPKFVQQGDQIGTTVFRVFDADSASDQVQPGYTFTVNGGPENPGLPNGLQLNQQEATPPGEEPGEAIWWLEGKALVGPGKYKIQVNFTDETGNKATAPTVEANVEKETGFQIELLDGEQTLRTPGSFDVFTGFNVSGMPVGRPRDGKQAYRVTISDPGNVQKHSQPEWFFANVDEATDLSGDVTLEGETSGKFEIVKDYQVGWTDRRYYFHTEQMFVQPEGPGTPYIANAHGEEDGIPFFRVNSGPKPREQWNIRVEVGGAEGPVRFNAWLGRTALNLGGTELHVDGIVVIRDTDGSPLSDFSGYKLYADLPSGTQGPWDILNDPLGLGTGLANPSLIFRRSDFIVSPYVSPVNDLPRYFGVD